MIWECDLLHSGFMCMIGGDVLLLLTSQHSTIGLGVRLVCSNGRNRNEKPLIHLAIMTESEGKSVRLGL